MINDRDYYDYYNYYYVECGEFETDEGMCDNCTTSVGAPAVVGPLGPMYCACAIGQGADPDECHCTVLDADNEA